VSALITSDDIKALGQQIDDLAFAFIAPLGAYDCYYFAHSPVVRKIHLPFSILHFSLFFMCHIRIFLKFLFHDNCSELSGPISYSPSFRAGKRKNSRLENDEWKVENGK